MKTLWFRLLAYVGAGMGFGGGAWLTAVGIPLIFAASSALAGLGLMLWAMHRAHDAPLIEPPEGMRAITLRITPGTALIGMDIVALIASALTCFFALDGFGPRLAGFPPLVTDPLAADVIAVLFLPSALVLAGFVTSTGEQRLSLGPDGLFLSSPFGGRSARWPEITSLGWRDEYVVVSRVGLPIRRRLRTNLAIETADGCRLTVYEPATASRRRHLLDGLKRFAPAHLTANLTAAA
ncbi:hypothetical protein KUW09_06060 [Mameliella alba]|nr:hypothetical protein [Antarctobacter heliothermus]MBY6143598.1 hypothetical protein [Mameliella alba]MCA0952678.1 hypothetical protein [Mameliella alba]